MGAPRLGIVLFAALVATSALACGKKGGGGVLTPTWEGIVEDPEPQGGHRIRSLTASQDHVCALYANGGVACWGMGAERAFGRTIPPHSAVRVAAVTDARRLSVGSCGACALDPSGALTCWGFRGAFCEYGDDAEVVLPWPTRIDGVRFRNVASSVFGDVMCGVDDFGSHHCVSPECTTPLRKDAPCLRARMKHFAYPPDGKGFYAPGALTHAVDIVPAASGGLCFREESGQARCFSDHITDGTGKPFVALQAPAEPVTRAAGFFETTCFVLRSGGVECRSTDGIVVPKLSSPARTADGGYRTGCATGVDGSLTCWKHDIVAQDDRKNPEYPVARITREDRAAHARMVVHDGTTYCTLDDRDVVLCDVQKDDGAGNSQAYAVALP